MTQYPKVGEICWNELATNNLQASKDFYGKVFGWTFHDMVMGDMTYTIIKVNDKDFGGIWSIPKDIENVCKPHWMAYILVDNLNKSLEKAQKNGATIAKSQTQAGDAGVLAIIKDPTGAHIALWEPQ